MVAEPRTRSSAARVGIAHDPTKGFIPVIWTYLARLDEIPCDVFVRTGRRAVLYATTGASPHALREKARRGVALLVREADGYLLRRMLTVSLERTLADRRLTPMDRSRQAYAIAASIVAPTFRPATEFSGDEARLAQDTIDMLTNVLVTEDDTLWSMVASMQRSQVTHSHAINTAIFALALAKRMGISDIDQLRDVGRGALLSDIGLTTLPARVVENPDELDPLAARALRQHPAVGYAIVTRAVGETPSYAHVVLEHHERVDGSGYPAGRKSNQIALDAQIAGVADTYDSLVTSRREHVGLSPYEACKQMRFSRPGQFADDLLRAFIETLGGWSSIRGGS